MCGLEQLRDISGPGSVIDDSRGSAFCIAAAAGECRPDSQPGYAYVRCNNVVRFWSAGGEGVSSPVDVSLNDFAPSGSAVVLYGFAPNREGVKATWGPEWRGFGYSRVLTQMLAPMHNGIITAKVLPNGKWVMFATDGLPRWDVWIAKVPPYSEKDSIDRTRHVPVVLQLTPPPDVAADNAVVEFGYAENGDPAAAYCTSRQETCITVAAEVPADPFKFPIEGSDQTEKGVAGQPCGSGCSIAIPGLPQHVMYYKVKYRDAGNQVLAETPLQAYAVP